MTQMTLNIENHEMLGVLKKLIKHLNGVTIAYTTEKLPSKNLLEAFEDVKNGRVSESFTSIDALMNHLDQ